MANERTYLTVLASLDSDLSKLEGREDSAAVFAREHLSAWRSQLRGNLNACRRAQSKCDPARIEREAAQTAFDEKRAELLAAVELELEPFAKRVKESEQAYKDASRSATLGEITDRVPFAYIKAQDPHTDPGSTRSIADLARKNGFNEFRAGNACAELAHAKRSITAPEMVAAIAAEADYPDDQFPGAPEAFELRWQRWATTNGVDVGPKVARLAKLTRRPVTPDNWCEPEHAEAIQAQQKKNYPNAKATVPRRSTVG